MRFYSVVYRRFFFHLGYRNQNINMASLNASKKKKEFTFEWRIENYSYSWHTFGEFLISPVYIADLFQKTSWTLCLYPSGDEDRQYSSCYLQREIKDEGPPSIVIRYEISCIAADGTILRLFEGNKNGHVFESGTVYGTPQFIPRVEVLKNKPKSYLPKDTLTLSCRMWTADESSNGATQCFARTRIQVETISFIHSIEYFSSLQPGMKQAVNVSSCSEAKPVISVGVLATNGSCCEAKIVLEVTPGDKNLIDIFTCRVELLNADGRKIKCGHTDTRFDLERKGILHVPLIFTRKKLLEKKGEFLINDSLTLICECSFSSGLEFEKIEKTVYGPQWITTPSSEGVGLKIPETSNICDDYRCLLNDPVLSDVLLQSKAKTFPSHKIVLAARSSVFKDLFTSDVFLKENKDSIEIEDLEDETLQRLLVFMYTDMIEDLHWDIASKLYYAANKYQIQRLKAKCTSFLLSCLNTANASDLLLLAHVHQDSDLKEAVESFIMENETEVFGSMDWEALMETNPGLAMKTMHLKFKKNRLVI